MKHLIIFCIVILTACNTNKSNDSSSNTLNNPIEITSNKIEPNYISILNGDWVEMSYIDDLIKTKSPFKSQEILKSIVELYIDVSMIKGDSLVIDSPSIHEGMSFIVYFKHGITANAFPTNYMDYENESNFYELGFSISNKDTTLLFYRYNKNKKLLERNQFKRVPKNSEGALQYTVNKILFEGIYQMTDANGESTTVEFTDDGKIRGLSGFNTYKILTDFVAGPINGVDEVCFDFQKNNQICYAYKITDKSINLYETIIDEDHEFSTYGKLKYKLLKQ